MKEISIKHEYKTETYENVEIKKIKWLIDSLAEIYSYKAVEVAIDKIYKKS